MRNSAAIPALALLLLTGATGCTAAAEENEPAAAPSPGSASPSPTRSASPAAAPAASAKDSLEESCGKLHGTDGIGPLSQASYFVRVGGTYGYDGTYGFEGPIESVMALDGQLKYIARTAPAETKAQMDELVSSMGKAIRLIDNSGAGADFRVDTWQSTIADLEATCAPYQA